MGKKWPSEFSLQLRFPGNCKDVLHAAKLRHGADGYLRKGSKAVGAVAAIGAVGALTDLGDVMLCQKKAKTRDL
jgi:hypothetical protein